MALTKMDVLDYFDFDPAEAERMAKEIQPDLDILHMSAKTGDGIHTWVEFLKQRREERLAVR
jgi:hydrogenase nickel incorporation protein HypB